ncbi:PIN domain-containing protein [soil metagenome]
MIVLDASAAITILLNTGPSAEAIRLRVGHPDQSLHVPHLFEVEVLHALRRLNLSGCASSERALIALTRLRAMILIRYPHTAFLPRIWELRENVTAYDASYIALAETLNSPLVTTDAKLARASGIRAEVELYE